MIQKAFIYFHTLPSKVCEIYWVSKKKDVGKQTIVQSGSSYTCPVALPKKIKYIYIYTHILEEYSALTPNSLPHISTVDIH